MSAPRAERGSNFYLGFLFLSKPKREALKAVYGFCRHIDDIVDAGNMRPEEAQESLDNWREEIERLYKGKPTQELAQRVFPYVERYHLPKQAFLGLIGGVEMDLRRKRYDTFSELEPYLYGVAVTVGLLCVEIFGHEHTPPEQAREYAKNMGYAFQLTNILRDVGTDLEDGRIYLPRQDIEKAGYSIDALIRREHTPAFEALMNQEYDRARTFYQRARNCIDPQDRPSMLPAEIMARVYEDILEQMKASGFRVFFQKTKISAWRKAWLALAGIAYSYGIY